MQDGERGWRGKHKGSCVGRGRLVLELRRHTCANRTHASECTGSRMCARSSKTSSYSVFCFLSSSSSFFLGSDAAHPCRSMERNWEKDARGSAPSRSRPGTRDTAVRPRREKKENALHQSGAFAEEEKEGGRGGSRACASVGVGVCVCERRRELGGVRAVRVGIRRLGPPASSLRGSSLLNGEGARSITHTHAHTRRRLGKDEGGRRWTTEKQTTKGVQVRRIRDRHGRHCVRAPPAQGAPQTAPISNDGTHTHIYIDTHA